MYLRFSILELKENILVKFFSFWMTFYLKTVLISCRAIIDFKVVSYKKPIPFSHLYGPYHFTAKVFEFIHTFIVWA